MLLEVHTTSLVPRLTLQEGNLGGNVYSCGGMLNSEPNQMKKSVLNTPSTRLPIRDGSLGIKLVYTVHPDSLSVIGVEE